MKIFYIVLIFTGMIYSSCFATQQQKVVLKIATLGAKNSEAAEILENWKVELEEKTNNAVKFRIYWGGIQGDDNNVLRKIRLKQLHGGILTSAGLGQIASEIRTLEMPYIFRNHKEIFFVRSKLIKNIKNCFADNGFVLLGLFNLGFVYHFSNVPITSHEISKKQKAWAPDNDPLIIAWCKALNISPITLSIPEVMSSLSSNLVNSIAAPISAALAFRWYTKFKYMHDFPALNVIGGIVVSKKIFDTISPDNQKVIKEMSDVLCLKTEKVIRKLNKDSVKTLKKGGIKLVHIPHEYRDWLINKGKKVSNNLAGQLYSKKLLDQILALLNQYRKEHPESKYETIKY